MKSPRTAVALVVVVRTSKTLRYPSSRFVVPVVVALRVRRGDGDGDVPVPRTAATILPPVVVVVLVVLNVVSAVVSARGVSGFRLENPTWEFTERESTESTTPRVISVHDETRAKKRENTPEVSSRARALPPRPLATSRLARAVVSSPDGWTIRLDRGKTPGEKKEGRETPDRISF